MYVVEITFSMTDVGVGAYTMYVCVNVVCKCHTCILVAIRHMRLANTLSI